VRAALAVVPVGADPAANTAAVLAFMHEAADRGADLVLFPEGVITGLINTDDPVHDLLLAQEVPGPATDAVATVAARRGLWVCFGLLERAGEQLYDSAVLIDDAGHLRLKHRRINPGWHGRQASPETYREGTEVPVVVTPWGRMAILICGDLFDERAVAGVHEAAPDWLLFPFARCFSGGGVSQARWDAEELPAYAARVRLAGVPALMVNYLADAVSLPEDQSFGGAFVVSSEGQLVASKVLGETGLLVVDLD
jgi:predicted amidohydrolase